jgi:hypothetical protein
LASRAHLTTRFIVAACAGAPVAIVSGEAAIWMPAVLIDAMLAATSCVVVSLGRPRLTRMARARSTIAVATHKA